MVVSEIVRLSRDVLDLKRDASATSTVHVDLTALLSVLSGTDTLTGVFNDIGSCYVLNHTLLGDLGSGTNQVNPQSYLGDSRAFNASGTFTTT